MAEQHNNPSIIKKESRESFGKTYQIDVPANLSGSERERLLDVNSSLRAFSLIKGYFNNLNQQKGLIESPTDEVKGQIGREFNRLSLIQRALNQNTDPAESKLEEFALGYVKAERRKAMINSDIQIPDNTDQVVAYENSEQVEVIAEGLRELRHDVVNLLEPAQKYILNPTDDSNYDRGRKGKVDLLQNRFSQLSEVLDGASEVVTNTYPEEFINVQSLFNKVAGGLNEKALEHPPREIAGEMTGIRVVLPDKLPDEFKDHMNQGVMWSHTRITRLVVNVIQNANRYIDPPEGFSKKVALSFDIVERDGKKFARIKFNDNGKGFSEEMVKNKKFTRGQSTGEGEGLGLVGMAASIEHYGGILYPENQPLKAGRTSGSLVAELPLTDKRD